MGRKINRVRYRLDDRGIQELPFEEIKAILRGADDLITTGGRSMLAKILKGSKDKKLLELDLNNLPVFGYFKNLSIEEITAKIDWVILNGYMQIEYSYRLPVLVYTQMGWEIEMDTYSDELLEGFDKMLREGVRNFNMSYLKDKNRRMIMLLLDKIEATEDPKYIPILEAWKKVDYKKVTQRINKVIATLKDKIIV
jgi:superfamily II DNA helicase RecQ